MALQNRGDGLVGTVEHGDGNIILLYQRYQGPTQVWRHTAELDVVLRRIGDACEMTAYTGQRS